MTRTGKIARLPREVREQLNRRLQNGEPGKKLIAWLNSLPEVQAVLKAEFNERPVSAQNLSEWKAGGYREWLSQQEAVELVRKLAENSKQLQQDGHLPLTDQFALWLTTRYLIAAKSLLGGANDDPASWQKLRDVCNDVVALRRGDQHALRLDLERERLDYDKEQLRQLRDEEFRDWAQKHRDELCKGYKTQEERILMLRQALFGDVDTLEASGEVELPDCPLPDQANCVRPDPTESNQIKP